MKEALSILFLFLYIIPAIGVNVSLHYCGKKLSSFSLNGESVVQCFCGSKKAKKSCCSDKSISIKLSDDQQENSKFITGVSKGIGGCFAPAVNLFFADYFGGDVDAVFLKQHPPNNVNAPLYIVYGVFRI